MSRSFRKSNVISYYSGLKKGRSYYHHAHRRIEHLILKECEKLYSDCSLDEEIKKSPEAYIIKNKKNRSVNMSNRFHWLTWYLQEHLYDDLWKHEKFIGIGISSLCRQFNSEIFGLYVEKGASTLTSDVWQRYLNSLNDDFKSKTSFVDITIKYGLAKKKFSNHNELVFWFCQHQKKLISTYIKLNYRK